MAYSSIDRTLTGFTMQYKLHADNLFLKPSDMQSLRLLKAHLNLTVGNVCRKLSATLQLMSTDY